MRIRIQREYMRPIEKYLDRFDEADIRQKSTAKLLISFALAESGKKLPSDPRDQRRYMRNQYENLRNEREKRKFVRHLSHMAKFMASVWKQEERAFPAITEFTDKNVVLMCIDVLGKADHHITIAPLTRFYSQVLLASPDSRAGAVHELEEATKAMTAFFALWRGSGKPTGSLSDAYRELMERGLGEIQPFSRQPKGGVTPEDLTAEKLRHALRFALRKGRTTSITSKEDWVRLSAERSIYNTNVSKALTRFLLFASTHDTIEDEDKSSGLPVAGRPGILNMLIWSQWNSDLTIEHVAPQESTRSGWLDSLYEKPDLVDYLGNLTLLPKSENSSFGGRPWQAKKAMYRVLSLPTQNALEVHLEEVENLGIQLSESTKNLLRAGKYLQHLSAICNVDEWNEEFVNKRSKRLAELIWTNVAPWLGFDDE